MIKELIRNGAMETDISVQDLHGVREGGNVNAVYSSVGKEEKSGSPITELKLKDYGSVWQKNDHSMMIIGYGVDKKNDEKYWIVRNSYGTSWANQGDIRIRRGRNDMMIETHIAVFDPVLCG